MRDDFAISAGTVDITPQRPAMLGGYPNRRYLFTAIADRLEANVMVFRGTTSQVTIVSTDLLYPGSALRSELLENLGMAGREHELFLCASHTHYAPMTASMPLLGEPDLVYVREVASRIAERIRSLDARGTPSVVTYHEGMLNHSMNRRLRALRLTRSGLARKVGMGPNPDGARDERARILRFQDKGGQPLAVIWNYACHVCDFFDKAKVSAGYPGVVRSRLRAHFGPVPVLFLQGFSGDLRPPFSGAPHSIKGLTRRALLGPQFQIPGKSMWEEWTASMAVSVAEYARSASLGLQLHSPVARRAQVGEEEYAVGGRGDKPLVWHVVDCGAFRIAGINAEPVVEYRALVEEQLAGVPLLTAGCLDQTHCYLPVDAMVPEGGYEVEGFRKLFGFEARFRKSLQAPVLEGLRRASDISRRPSSPVNPISALRRVEPVLPRAGAPLAPAPHRCRARPR